MKAAICFGASTILLAILAYSINFNHWLGFSPDTGDWGTFGDFVGGFSNPVLTFITMCMLIKSLQYQREANDSLINQNTHIKTTETLRSFESTFYSLAEVARQEYSRLRIPNDKGDLLIESAAVCYIEEKILDTTKAALASSLTIDLDKLFNDLDDRSSMTIFSCVRSFYILFKITCDSCPEERKKQYIEICSYIMPMKLINLVCIAKAYSEWEILDLLSTNHFFERPGLKEYLQNWSDLKFLDVQEGQLPPNDAQ